MNLSIRRSKPKPKTPAERVADVARSAGSLVDSQRKRAFALAGGAAGAAGAFAFWRSRRDNRPPTHTDPARAATGPAQPAANPAVKPPAEAGTPQPADEPAKSGATG